MSTFILGFVLILCSAVSLWDAARITSTLRMPGAFDLVGPDRYLLGVAILIGGLGAGLMVQSLGELRRWRPKVLPLAAVAQDDPSNRHIALIGLILLYAIAMSIVGYLVATFAFLVVTFKVMGMRDWRWILASSVGTTAGLYIAFIRIADMALPTGLWELG